jgi:hypothetical protein
MPLAVLAMVGVQYDMPRLVPDRSESFVAAVSISTNSILGILQVQVTSKETERVWERVD